MEKRIILLLLIILCACEKKYACEYKRDEIEIYIDINADNNVIKDIEINEFVNIDDSLYIFNKELGYLNDNPIHFHKIINDNFNLDKTIDALRRKYFYCERIDA